LSAVLSILSEAGLVSDWASAFCAKAMLLIKTSAAKTAFHADFMSSNPLILSGLHP
jgi:hypothetical protein